MKSCLVQAADTNFPRGGYIKKIEQDPWGNEYLYLSPAEYGEGDFEIISLGAKGEEGGEGQETDVINSRIDEYVAAMKELNK